MAVTSLAIDWGSLDDTFSEVVVVPSSASPSVSAISPTGAVTPELAEMPDYKLTEKVQRNNEAEEKTSRPTTRESFYQSSEPNSSFKKSYRSYNAPLSVKNFYGKEKAFENEFILLGRDKCKTMDMGKKLKASRKGPARSFSDRGHSREKNNDQWSERSFSDRTKSRIRSAGYSNLSSYISSKRTKAWKSEDPLDSDPDKVTNVVLLDDDDDVETPEQTATKEISDTWEECKMYYPSRNDSEAIELGYSDIKCLGPGEYLSSPVMNFYIQYMKQSLCQTSRPIQSYYIFNTYFYQKLEEAFDGKDVQSSFVKLRRWWKGVNIFEKAYIILPIHGRLHWSLVIICIPTEESRSGPIVLHLDSLGCHTSSIIFNTIG